MHWPRRVCRTCTTLVREAENTRKCTTTNLVTALIIRKIDIDLAIRTDNRRAPHLWILQALVVRCVAAILSKQSCDIALNEQLASLALNLYNVVVSRLCTEVDIARSINSRRTRNLLHSRETSHNLLSCKVPPFALPRVLFNDATA